MSRFPAGVKVLVTGGSSGIGAELVAALRARGNPVVVLARRAGETPAAEGVFPFPGDLSDSAGLPALAARLLAAHPDLGALVNNAGLQLARPLTDPALRAEDVVAEAAVNLIAPALLAKALLPGFRARGEGWIVNISSGLAVFPKERTALYCATKAGLSSLTQSLRWQVEGQDIRVVEVLLPLVETPMTAGRGRGKISAARAAAAILHGLDRGQDVVRVGKAGLLPWVARIAPGLGLRMMRRG